MKVLMVLTCHDRLGSTGRKTGFWLESWRRPSWFERDTDVGTQFDSKVRLDSVRQEDYDTVFCPGSHGPMWDPVDDKNSINLLESFVAAAKVFAVVCHSSGALRHIRTPNSKMLVEGKTVTRADSAQIEQ